MRWLSQKVYLPLFILLFLSTPLFSQANGPKTTKFTGKVVGVADGDAISVMRAGRAVKVRLNGIDCPERKQAFGMRGKRFTSEMAFGKEVEVRIKTTA